MQFFNVERGECKLLKCDKDKYLVQLLQESTSLPFVVTTHILTDGRWLHAEYFATYDEANSAYLSLRESEKRI